MLGSVTRYQTSIAVCLLLILLALVIHPDFDIPNAKMHRGVSAVHFAVLWATVPPLVLTAVHASQSDLYLAHLEKPRQLLLPLLC